MSVEIRKYMDIERFKDKYAQMFTSGEKIVVESKIDGANSSIRFDPDSDKIIAFSRKTKLNEVNNLRGFWDFTQRLNPETVRQITKNGRYIIYGEWLCPHSVRYPEHRYNHWYVFDVFDTGTNQYLPYIDTLAIFSDLEKMAQRCGEVLYFVPVIYEGPFISWEHLMEFLKKDTTGAQPCEEGIVIKSQDRLGDKGSKIPTCIKIVNERFSEVHNSKPKKPIDPTVLAAREAERQMIASVVTERRVAKILEKLIDEGIIPEDWDEKDMSVIAKNIGKLTYEDCIKEEPEVVAACELFGKTCSSLAMGYVKEWLKTR